MRVRRWIGAHFFRSVPAFVIPVLTADFALNSDADWIGKSLLILSGLAWSGVLLTDAVRHRTVPVAGMVTALSGGWLTLLLDGATSTLSQAESEQLAIGLLALGWAGAATLWGQFENLTEQRRTSAVLNSTLADLAQSLQQIGQEQQEQTLALQTMTETGSLPAARCECDQDGPRILTGLGRRARRVLSLPGPD